MSSEPPHRNPDKLRSLWNQDEIETVADVARELDVSRDCASKWLARYGIREKQKQSFAQAVQSGAIDPSGGEKV